MSKFCYKVLNMSDSYLFKNKKFFSGPIADMIENNNILMESNINQCKDKILSKYKYQSVTVYKFDVDKLKNVKTKPDGIYLKNQLDYNGVVKYNDIIFDENNILLYYKKINELDKKI